MRPVAASHSKTRTITRVRVTFHVVIHSCARQMRHAGGTSNARVFTHSSHPSLRNGETGTATTREDRCDNASASAHSTSAAHAADAHKISWVSTCTSTLSHHRTSISFLISSNPPFYSWIFSFPVSFSLFFCLFVFRSVSTRYSCFTVCHLPRRDFRCLVSRHPQYNDSSWTESSISRWYC